MMESAEERGRKEGIQLSKTVLKMKHQGVSEQEIARLCDITEEEVAEILS